MNYRLATLLVTWFSAGRSPKMSGTAGSLAALPFALAIQLTLGNVALMIASVLIFLLGCWASRVYLAAHPEKDDPGEIVIDEVAGQWLTLSMLFPTWQSYLVGFILFRLFDIIKPWPVSWADNQHGWLGVMLDDMLAGFYPVAIFLIIMIEAQLGGPDVQTVLKPIMMFLGGR